MPAEDERTRNVMEARIELIATRLEHVQAPPYLSRLLQHEDSLPRGREDARSREPPHPASDYHHVELCRYLRKAKPQRVGQRCSAASTLCCVHWELHQTHMEKGTHVVGH